MGITAAVGGGSFRGRPPKVFERGEPYALLAATVFLICDRFTGNVTLPTSVGLATGFLFRLLALHFNWKTRPVR